METVSPNNNESDYIVIPNPIYDVVFRYLMEDPESAMIVISTLINENIKNLHFEPNTHSEKKEKPEYAGFKDPLTKDDIRLFHLDFTATVILPDGSEELIMIELQKATEPDDIFRFKRYISKNFQKKCEIEVMDLDTHSIRTVIRPIRLIPVFILNFRIENEINDLLIQTSRVKEGIFKNLSLQKPNDFIDNLTYDMLVIQLPNLENISEDEYKDDGYKSKLYAMLKLFDQKSRVKDNEHRLRLIRKFFPGFLERVIRRLQSADIDNPELEENMFAEDVYLRALVERDNKISFFQEKLEKTVVELELTYEELGKASKQLEKTSEQLEIEKMLNIEKDNALETEKILNLEKDKALEIEKSKTKQLQLTLAMALKENGVPLDVIHQKTGLPMDEITEL
jgi:hypothetical protein